MVYGSLSAITFLILLKNHESIAQCAGRVELLPQCGDVIPSTAYIQPVGQVCFPAVIQIPDNNNYPNCNTPTGSDDDDFLTLIFLLISALTGCSNNGNSCSRISNCNSNGRSSPNGYNSNSCPPNNNPSSNFNLLSALIPCLSGNPSSNSGYICDICASNSCPCPNFNQPPPPSPYASPSPSFGYTCDICASNSCPSNFIQNTAPTSYSGPNSNNGYICDICSSNNLPCIDFNAFSSLIPSFGNIPIASPGNICSNNNASPNLNVAPTCIYVPFPIAVPMNIPGLYNECDDGPQEINLIINTECD